MRAYLVPPYPLNPGSSGRKNLPAVQETQVLSPGWKDLLEKGMSIHSSILAGRIPWTEEPGSLQSWGHKESDTTTAECLILSL